MTGKMDQCVIASPLGALVIQADAQGVTALYRDRDAAPSAPVSPLLRLCSRQLEEYFAGVRREFDIPLHLEGTPFQLVCWKALLTIPYGETRTYAQQAAMVGKPRAARAVGGANHVNPVCLIVPCHRVIGAGGSLTGYGAGLDMKEWLLRHERAHA